mmetsp:Transcript_20264/g.44952  ORF Transcript_20264/g.44952 Transcript_20264/m.44952 type:complete len:372 (-) Transcript_20264:178-1293(-)
MPLLRVVPSQDPGVVPLELFPRSLPTSCHHRNLLFNLGPLRWGFVATLDRREGSLRLPVLVEVQGEGDRGTHKWPQASVVYDRAVQVHVTLENLLEVSAGDKSIAIVPITKVTAEETSLGDNRGVSLRMTFGICGHREQKLLPRVRDKLNSSSKAWIQHRSMYKSIPTILLVDLRAADEPIPLLDDEALECASHPLPRDLAPGIIQQRRVPETSCGEAQRPTSGRSRRPPSSRKSANSDKSRGVSSRSARSLHCQSCRWPRPPWASRQRQSRCLKELLEEHQGDLYHLHGSHRHRNHLVAGNYRRHPMSFASGHTRPCPGGLQPRGARRLAFATALLASAAPSNDSEVVGLRHTLGTQVETKCNLLSNLQH